MRVLSYQVPESWGGGPVSAFAKRELGFSARALAGVKFEGGILVNGEPRHANALLSPGDCLSFRLPEEEPPLPPLPVPEDAALPFSVLYEDEDCLIVDKPPRMPVHPSPGHDRDSLVTALAGYYARTGQRSRARPLYRLDKDTSGVLPLAKHRVAAGAKLDKVYLAVCQGEFSGAGVIDSPIGLAEGSKIKRTCGEGPGFQPARTRWRALASREGHTLLALGLETGRTHQIRVHMAHIGHPLAGDDLYGGSRELLSRQALHCAGIRFACRALGVDRKFTAPVPEDILNGFPWIGPYIHGAERGIDLLPR